MHTVQQQGTTEKVKMVKGEEAFLLLAAPGSGREHKINKERKDHGQDNGRIQRGQVQQDSHSMQNLKMLKIRLFSTRQMIIKNE